MTLTRQVSYDNLTYQAVSAPLGARELWIRELALAGTTGWNLRAPLNTSDDCTFLPNEFYIFRAPNQSTGFQMEKVNVTPGGAGTIQMSRLGFLKLVDVGAATFSEVSQ